VEQKISSVRGTKSAMWIIFCFAHPSS